MNTKVDEGKLINGKEAKLAWASGETIQIKCTGGFFELAEHRELLNVFDNPENVFRLKPRTISINGIEAPSIKKESAIYRSNDTVAIVCESFEDAELMCLALRQVFGGSHDN